MRRSLAGVALGSLFALATLPAQTPSVVGRWNLDLVNQFGGSMKIAVTFKQEGHTLTGLCTGDELGSMTAAGEMNGSQINWRCSSEEHGEKQIATFTGTLNPNGYEMKGDWSTVINGTFSGVLQR